MRAWRGHTLVIEKSHLYVGGVVLRDPLTLKTVTPANSHKAAEKYCRDNGYSWMDAKPVDQSIVDMRF